MAAVVLADGDGGSWTQHVPAVVRAVALVREPQRCARTPADGGGPSPHELIEQLRPRRRESIIRDGENQAQADRLHVRPRVVVAEVLGRADEACREAVVRIPLMLRVRQGVPHMQWPRSLNLGLGGAAFAACGPNGAASCAILVLPLQLVAARPSIPSFILLVRRGRSTAPAHRPIGC
eukprot:2308893-Pyramimonas_sp.AAC.1